MINLIYLMLIILAFGSGYYSLGVILIILRLSLGQSKKKKVKKSRNYDNLKRTLSDNEQFKKMRDILENKKTDSEELEIEDIKSTPLTEVMDKTDINFKNYLSEELKLEDDKVEKVLKTLKGTVSSGDLVKLGIDAERELLSKGFSEKDIGKFKLKDDFELKNELNSENLARIMIMKEILDKPKSLS
ncbi:hypothetical protein [Anaerosphaera multitolerans]|uniref:Uncharacterized protein n=1 Tax=Anaerosphaera multitolerans TaxID=2487351 RepID=A0A437S914_9FIRM|nr:hypothetical protein [Anaerosphaera multitolerans]RVU55327.1 hypothetical protein EF514_03390 [Anaerosphaera multitolerans]